LVVKKKRELFPTFPPMIIKFVYVAVYLFFQSTIDLNADADVDSLELSFFRTHSHSFTSLLGLGILT
jgi:hypothetical protein